MTILRVGSRGAPDARDGGFRGPSGYRRAAGRGREGGRVGGVEGKPLRDVIAPDLDVLFVGINPSLLSAERGHHFARPGNRFWPALHAAGITPRRLSPDEDGTLPALGVGITNLADRPTRAASELTAEELRAGAAALGALVAEYEPGLLAVVGVTAYRVAFAHPRASFGPQEDRIGGRPVWVLPNPSGL